MAVNLTYAAQATVLSQSLADVLNSSVLKDVVLACSEGRCLQAHRLILVTFSPYFKQLLTVCKEPTPTILLPDLSVTVMEVLLEFMYTGNIRVKKDLVAELVEANRRLRITGLDDLLSKHTGESLPPKKKQRVECRALPSVKPSSLFRPWDTPALAPSPVYDLPWMNPLLGAATLSNSMPFPIAFGMPFPMSAGNSLFSSTAPSLPTPIIPWTMSYGNHFLSETSPSIPVTTNLPRLPAKPTTGNTIFSENHFLSKTAPLLTVATSLTKHVNVPAPRFHKAPGTTKRPKTTVELPKTEAPGKERCDICNKAFRNITSHKIMAHKQLKKPIKCCGNEFTTRLDLKMHKMMHKKTWKVINQ